MSEDFTKLKAWQVAFDVGFEIYELSCRFPNPHLYTLGDQMRRAALSISNNIAEGFGRRHSRDKARFYAISYGSACELKNMLLYTRKLKLLPEDRLRSLYSRLDEACRLSLGLREGMERWIDP